MTGVIKLAILAVGGQGGGVLTGWIETLARANGYLAQSTMVAGVAQRTGATVYYVEMAPAQEPPPVFALMPAAGDVDVMIAAELMEAGRAIQRGFVTPDRTTLITSTHRALAVSEKMAPGDGIASSDEVMAAAELAARRLIAADFNALAAGSVISASLFGGLAGSGVLPFDTAAFRAAIAAGGRGVEASLRAFEAGLAGLEAAPLAAPPRPDLRGPDRLMRAWQALTTRAEALPASDMVLAGLRKVVDFQDIAYGATYLDRVARVAALDCPPHEATREAAKHIANAMVYDDLIRVADLKTRASRQPRIAAEMGAVPGHLVQVTEFFHPRAAELVSLFPAGIGARWAGDPARMARLDRLVSRARRIRSDGLIGFVTLYLIAGLRFWRPRSLRHMQEVAHLEAWLDLVLSHMAANPGLAAEILRCRRLVKGYSDTHARGLSKFDRVLAGITRVTDRADAADWARRLREAALQDEEGKALDGALCTIDSFVAP